MNQCIPIILHGPSSSGKTTITRCLENLEKSISISEFSAKSFVSGSARVSEEELENLNMELKVFNPDENSKILQGMIIEIEESYGHCPRAFSFSSLWDVDQILEKKGEVARLNK